MAEQEPGARQGERPGPLPPDISPEIVSLIKATPTPTFLTTRDALVYCNKAGLDLLGNPASVALPPSDLLERIGARSSDTHERVALAESSLGHALSRHEGRTEVLRVAGALGGPLRLAHATATPLRAGDDALVLWSLAFVTDFATSSLLQNLPVLVWRTDNSGALVFANAAWLEFRGRSLEEERGQGWAQGVHPHDVRHTMVEYWKSFRERAPLEVQFRLRNHAGEYRPVLAVARPIWNRADRSEFRGYAGVSLDVTRWKQREDELRESEKLESVARISGVVAHDLNALLAGIQSYLDGLQDNEHLGLDSRSRLAAIEERVRSGIDMVEQLLILGREQPVHPVSVSLNQQIEALAAVLRRMVEPDIELVLDRQDGLPPVRLDTAQFDQMILHLAANAKAAMPEGGRLTIRTRSSPASEGTDAVFLDVEDTGIGMSQEAQDHLFEPFFSTGETTSGIGLASVYGIVHRMAGTIEVASEEGRGTIVTVKLPSPPGLHAAETAPPPPSLPLGMRVLLSEDDRSVRTVTRRLLERRGAHVVDVEGPWGAWQHLEAGETFDVLLMDQNSPQGPGTKFAQGLRTSHPSLPVVIMSGSLESEVMRDEDEPWPFLQKPFTEKELMTTLLRATGEERAAETAEPDAPPAEAAE